MPGRSAAEWEDLAVDVVIDILDRHGPMTPSEMEARASDRTWNVNIVNRGIDPHHLTTARQRLAADNRIVDETAPTRGGSQVTTWCLVERAGTKASVAAAARKRLLTARHDGWARRGGNGRGLIGAAGEQAMIAALHEAEMYAQVTHSTVNVLGVDLSRYGEVDITCGLYDITDPGDPRAVTVMIEVKNTRHWHYGDSVSDRDGDLRRFLKKAAAVQASRPDAAICPVIIARKAQQTLVNTARAHGFLVASTEVQLVLPDHDILSKPHHFDEVRDELGYFDLRLLQNRHTTNYHRGICKKHIPKSAREAAKLWRKNFVHYLA